MSLSLKAIDHLFDRLIRVYGKSFMAKWDGMPADQLPQMKTEWAYQLGGYRINLEAIAWALDNLPESPPNVIVFKNLCRSAPRKPDVLAIEVAADPKKIADELVKLVELKMKPSPAKYDGKAWARRIVEADKAGIKQKPINLRFAKEALKSSLEVL